MFSCRNILCLRQIDKKSHSVFINNYWVMDHNLWYEHYHGSNLPPTITILDSDEEIVTQAYNNQFFTKPQKRERHQTRVPWNSCYFSWNLSIPSSMNNYVLFKKNTLNWLKMSSRKILQWKQQKRCTVFFIVFSTHSSMISNVFSLDP